MTSRALSQADATAREDRSADELHELIAQLDLSDIQKRFLSARWLDQLRWSARAARRAARWYYGLRLVTVIGGILVPALVTLHVAGEPLTDGLAVTVSWLTFVLSLLVAIAASLESLFRFGDRYRHYRQAAEWLKMEGWRFMQLADRYGGDSATHRAAYPLFAARVEAAIGQEVDAFVSQVLPEAQPRKDGAR